MTDSNGSSHQQRPWQLILGPGRPLPCPSLWLAPSRKCHYSEQLIISPKSSGQVWDIPQVEQARRRARGKQGLETNVTHLKAGAKRTTRSKGNHASLLGRSSRTHNLLYAKQK